MNKFTRHATHSSLILAAPHRITQKKAPSFHPLPLCLATRAPRFYIYNPSKFLRSHPTAISSPLFFLSPFFLSSSRPSTLPSLPVPAPTTPPAFMPPNPPDRDRPPNPPPQPVTSFTPPPATPPSFIPVTFMQDPPQRYSVIETCRMRASMSREPPLQQKRHPATLPSALEYLSTLADKLVRERRRLVFFLDYDGTLSPIVEDPDSAIIPEKTREALSIVASRFTTAIVTGRSRKKVMSMVNLEQLIYAGSHGFDIEGPAGTVSHLVASDWRPSLKKAYDDLEQLVPRFPGSGVEDNLLSVSFHYRKCHPSLIWHIQKCVGEIAARYGLAQKKGKMVYELRPRFDWHKGKAVEYLLNALQLVGPEVLPIYIGDDVTDEDAFKVLQGKGISVIVADPTTSRDTHADMRLNDPKEVQDFLMHFAQNDSFAPKEDRVTVSSE